MSHEELGKLPLDVRARIAMLAAAEAQWRRERGVPLSAPELRGLIARLEVPQARHVPRVRARKTTGQGRSPTG